MPAGVGRCAPGGAGGIGVRLALHGEPDSLPCQVDFQHGDLDPLMDLHHIRSLFHEAVGELTDMHQAVLMHADVHECPEGGDVGDDARQRHAGLEIF